MTEGKILTRNVRFPKDNLPDLDFNPNKYPQWLKEIEVTYDDSVLVDGKGKYTIKRLNGPAAGDKKTPVFMNNEGQPQPITDLADSIIRSGNLNQRFLETEAKIAGAQVSVSENSPLLNIVETHGENNVDYEIQELISEFLTNNNDAVSILNNFKINKIPDRTDTIIKTIDVEVPFEEQVNHPIIASWSGTAKEFYDKESSSFDLTLNDSSLSYNPEDIIAVIKKVDSNGTVLASHSFTKNDQVAGSTNYYRPPEYLPQSEQSSSDESEQDEGEASPVTPDPAPTKWGKDETGNTVYPQVITKAFDISDDNILSEHLKYGLWAVNVENNSDLLEITYHYSTNDTVTKTGTRIEQREVSEDVVILKGLSQTFGEGLTSNIKNQVVIGQYNNPTMSPFIIGNGTDGENRSNLFEINSAGDVIITGNIKKADGTSLENIYIGENEPINTNILIWINPNT